MDSNAHRWMYPLVDCLKKMFRFTDENKLNLIGNFIDFLASIIFCFIYFAAIKIEN